jgi:receptor protein-tyrosine kinase
MSPSFPQRSHLVERAAGAARAAIAADASLVRVPRLPLAPVETILPAVEKAVPPASQRQAAAGARPNELPPVAPGLLRLAGLIDQAAPTREEIALVREQVLRSVEATPPAEGRQARLVMITSTRTGEGKSFAALNLAASIAEGAHRPVILADAEGGAGSLTSLLGLGSAPGLEQLCNTGDRDPAGLLRRTEIPDLFVLPHGVDGGSRAQGSVMAKVLLDLAARLADHIIILDTPACLESSTAGVLAAAAGQIALVVEAEHTRRPEVEAALDILDACPTLQLLLNRSALRVSDRFRGPAPRTGTVGVGASQA